ncbi:uncharacterized protein EI90DRAFT_3288393 [Cantharellus anzutake]|uniref:uncharacterized protein n=1 Tax=Cantharellus anzutake TaxID=1750568 RepID=UPI0019030119|nr:uncharacterized protein EI90DRAFT_3288393 [Cantharellus anzutake]KAF8334155.1 hypothetical protein EI90DRAFT_3288393 [Cantharellus anzutake]
MRFWSAFVPLTALLPIVTARFHYGLVSQGDNAFQVSGGIVPSLIAADCKQMILYGLAQNISPYATPNGSQWTAIVCDRTVTMNQSDPEHPTWTDTVGGGGNCQRIWNQTAVCTPYYPADNSTWSWEDNGWCESDFDCYADLGDMRGIRGDQLGTSEKGCREFSY